PRRAIRLVPEESPQVALLPEEFSPGAEMALAASDESIRFEGMPVPPGGRIRIAYRAEHEYGLGAARLWFRVLKYQPGMSSASVEDARKAQWLPLDLPEEKRPPRNAGPFVITRGAFLNSDPEDEIPFYPMPSPDPEHLLGRTIGGGRLDFETT